MSDGYVGVTLSRDPLDRSLPRPSTEAALRLAVPVVRALAKRDRVRAAFGDDVMLTGLSATAVQP